MSYPEHDIEENKETTPLQYLAAAIRSINIWSQVVENNAQALVTLLSLIEGNQIKVRDTEGNEKWVSLPDDLNKWLREHKAHNEKIKMQSANSDVYSEDTK